MNTNTWILVGLAAALCAIVVRSFFEFRSLRGKLRRKSLVLFGSIAVSWGILSFIMFDGMICLLGLAAIVGIYAPYLFWMLRHSSR